MPESTPPTPRDRVPPPAGILLTRGILYLIILSVGTAIFWASVTRVDIVVKADGKLTPRAGVLHLSAGQGGNLSEVLVQVGSHVDAGQVIMKVNPFKEKSEVSQLGHQLEATRLEAQRYRETAKQLRDAQAEARKEIIQQEGIRKTLADEAVRFRKLSQEGVVSEVEAQAKERAVAEVDARISRLRSEQERQDEEIQRNESQALAADAQAQSIEANLAKATEAHRRTVLTAPKAGVITSLISQTPGRYLAENEIAATLIPDDDPLVAEIKIPNASMRRVRPDLPVRLKLHAYPYQDFGVLTGRLEEIEPDSDEHGIYRAWVRPSRLTLEGPQGTEQLHTGLQLQAEIMVEQRRLIAIALDPFRKLKGGVTLSE